MKSITISFILSWKEGNICYSVNLFYILRRRKSVTWYPWCPNNSDSLPFVYFTRDITGTEKRISEKTLVLLRGFVLLIEFVSCCTKSQLNMFKLLHLYCKRLSHTSTHLEKSFEWFFGGITSEIQKTPYISVLMYPTCEYFGPWTLEYSRKTGWSQFKEYRRPRKSSLSSSSSSPTPLSSSLL